MKVSECDEVQSEAEGMREGTHQRESLENLKNNIHTCNRKYVYVQTFVGWFIYP